MINNMLYDRIISVTLHRYTEKKKVKTVSVIKNNTRSTLLANALNKGKVGNVVASIERIRNTSYTIDLIEGTTFSSQARRQNSIVVNYEEPTVYSTKFVARGPLFALRSMDELLKGTRPDGSPMVVGDRYKVPNKKGLYTIYSVVQSKKSDNSSWLRQLDSLASNTVREGAVSHSLLSKEESLTIRCPDQGMKPDISFTVNLIPGQNCYKMILKIKNLNLVPQDIRDWTDMQIVAGYRTGSTAMFTCPIFTSYIESPNPDGISVFEGITVGQTDVMLTNHAVSISFYKEQVTIQELVDECVKGISEGLEQQISVAPERMNTYISAPQQTFYAANGLAVLNWLQTTLTQLFKQLWGDSVIIQVLDGKFIMCSVNGPDAKSKITDSIVNLDCVSGATFSGTALTVVAPWNPVLKPGDLFYMPPEFITGSKLPNSLKASDYRNENNLYRALTMSISFGTVDNTNKMSILAVPSQYVSQFTDSRTTEMTPEKMQSVMYEYSQGLPQIHIRFGEPKNSSSNDITKGANECRSHVASGVASSGYTPGMCLSVIAENYLFNDLNGPQLLLKKGDGSGKEGAWYLPEKELEKIGTKAVQYYMPSGISATILWWPLICISTYWRKYTDDENNVKNTWASIDLNNPDALLQVSESGTPENNGNVAIYYPPCTIGTATYKAALTPFKDVYKNFISMYKDRQGYANWIHCWRAAYYWLGGTNDVG